MATRASDQLYQWIPHPIVLGRLMYLYGTIISKLSSAHKAEGQTLSNIKPATTNIDGTSIVNTVTTSSEPLSMYTLRFPYSFSTNGL